VVLYIKTPPVPTGNYKGTYYHYYVKETKYIIFTTPYLLYPPILNHTTVLHRRLNAKALADLKDEIPDLSIQKLVSALYRQEKKVSMGKRER
jgi:hypothetical protein